MKLRLQFMRLLFLCLAVGALPSRSLGQLLADSKTIVRQSDTRPQLVDLVDVLLKLKDKFQVDLLFEEKIVENIRVSVSSIRPSASFEDNLETLLRSTGIQYMKVKKGTYVLRNEKISIVQKPLEHVPAFAVDNRLKAVAMLERKMLHTPAKAADVTVTGRVTDEKGEVLPGVNVTVKGTLRGVSADASGNYSLSVPSGQVTLVFSFVGYVSQEVQLGEKKTLDVILRSDNKNLEEVVVVAFGTQRKESIVGAISSVPPNDLKVPVSKLSNALAGQIAGIVSVQGSGEPGSGSSFWIRGISSFGANNTPLILVDGIQRSMDLVDPEDIESFSILKDASATAVYGVRGANGIVLITTKKGKYSDKPTINARFERGFLAPIRLPKLANAEQWMDYYNDISYDANGSIPFPDHIKQKYLSGEDPDLYPNVDWMKTIYKDVTTSNRLNLNVTGGGRIARYYVSGSYYNENGLFNPVVTQSYNPSVKYNKFTFRSNLDVDITKSTELSLSLSNTYENKSRLGVDMATMYNIVMTTPPIAIAPYYSDGSHAQPLVGSNPYYSLNTTGFSQDFWNTAQSLMSLTQDLSEYVVPGLKFNVKFSWDATNESTLDKRKNPATYYATGRDDAGKLILHKNADGSDYLSLARSNRGTKTTNLESSLTYDNAFGDHRVGGLFLFTRREFTNNFPTNYILAFPYRNIGIAGRVTYAFKNKLFFDGNFGYNGSENFAPSHRFGFFPSIGLGYNLSKERFFHDLFPAVNLMKFRGSHGYIGNDQIGGDRRFAYNSEMQYSGSYTFGTTGQKYISGIATGNPGNPNVAWEEAIKTNIGFELGIWDKLKLQIDYFNERRDGIYILQQSVPSVVGINVAQYVNLGKMANRGVDGSIEYSYVKGDWLLSARGNFSYNRNKVIYNDSPTPIYGYQEVAGQAYNQQFGLVSMGLFKSVEDIERSPVQKFGSVVPGDIKFKDINGDGVVDSYDRVAIGRSTVPELSYGFGLSAKYKQFDLSAFFQGVGNVTRIIGGDPLQGPQGSILVNGQILADAAEKRWSLHNQDPNAEYARMSLAYNENNRQASTFYQRDMSFIRLKNAEIGYTVPKSIVGKAKVSSLRFYAQGVNLFTMSKFKLWDPELNASFGNIYPQMKTVSLGASLNF
ncbi:TonB-linked SusC/RagA family outer membrane protein [Dyadobacter sp. BE34]|uniref:TonB-linked SusC/RagA family outer membrane protein n=1 Tax=Dyadobacter fermentans TaxID=94254 RepID=A0ABU1R0D8_9BACT|nr:MULTISPECIES: TonB-dependent receptor [Dyadobacter]MDR6806869.1 TonB-linked SusC/RagA family outer membrane protein [Dyadobacter fermentans]MDR7044611.1 TonB-linked SusC/RagA family outer membrane protein [Dyadobacter sp. BE242]MDR7198921.1 TonB-linked SusC/RagA family outer membrane protein [Dyadobacter sp. BE34]MDR7263591.1 TonB-linked SusC/RagA family outer membrane protein [Dyadobacter sp. BE32]